LYKSAGPVALGRPARRIRFLPKCANPHLLCLRSSPSLGKRRNHQICAAYCRRAPVAHRRRLCTGQSDAVGNCRFPGLADSGARRKAFGIPKVAVSDKNTFSWPAPLTRADRLRRGGNLGTSCTFSGRACPRFLPVASALFRISAHGNVVPSGYSAPTAPGCRLPCDTEAACDHPDVYCKSGSFWRRASIPVHFGLGTRLFLDVRARRTGACNQVALDSKRSRADASSSATADSAGTGLPRQALQCNRALFPRTQRTGLRGGPRCSGHGCS
jgi:hypothetical protein